MTTDKPIPDDIRLEAMRALMVPEFDMVESVARAIMAERERDAKICEQQAQEFLSAEYAANQPIGSICERFACDACATAIRNGG